MIFECFWCYLAIFWRNIGPKPAKYLRCTMLYLITCIETLSLMRFTLKKSQKYDFLTIFFHKNAYNSILCFLNLLLHFWSKLAEIGPKWSMGIYKNICGRNFWYFSLFLKNSIFSKILAKKMVIWGLKTPTFRGVLCNISKSTWNFFS